MASTHRSTHTGALSVCEPPAAGWPMHACMCTCGALYSPGACVCGGTLHRPVARCWIGIGVQPGCSRPSWPTPGRNACSACSVCRRKRKAPGQHAVQRTQVHQERVSESAFKANVQQQQHVSCQVGARLMRAHHVRWTTGPLNHWWHQQHMIRPRCTCEGCWGITRDPAVITDGPACLDAGWLAACMPMSNCTGDCHTHF